MTGRNPKMMKIEERKPAPLPPLPWTMQLDPWGSRTPVVDAEGCVLAEVVGTDEEADFLADLFCRAPALESEIARLKTALAEASEIDRDALETSARRMNERDTARALLRELAARVSKVLEEWDTDGVVTSESVCDLRLVLRRVEADAGEEKDKPCPE